MTYVTQTESLKKVENRMFAVMDGLDNGSIEPTAALSTIRVGETIRRLTETDLKVRLSAPKLARIEQSV
ncbi:hypothetical protein ABTL56_19500, partial [Acinetobacter baumannii]